MPRSSRHKSSKHSSRDARDYSDPEKDLSLRERKSKEESVAATVSKESGSGDKRKFDAHEHYDSPNGEYYEERTSSKRHKEKIQDSGSDRWNGGDEERGETSKKSKTSSERSRRREDVEGEDTKKSSSGKHRESSRRESKELDKERDKGRDRKSKEGKSDKIFDGEDHHGSKSVPGKTGLKAEDQIQSPGSEKYPEKRSRRKREGHCTGHKHQGNISDGSDRVFTSTDPCLKDEKHKEEKCRDTNQVDTEEANRQSGDKQRDDQPEEEQSRSDGKNVCESKRKKTKFQKSDHGKEHGHEPDNGVDGCHDRPCEYENNQDYDRGRDRQRNRGRDRDRDRDRDLDRGGYERDRCYERDQDRGRSKDRDWDHERDRTHDREKDRGREYYHDRERSKTEHERESDRDALYLDQSGQYKDFNEKRSPDDQDDLSDSKSRITTPHTDIDTGGTRGQSDGDRARSQRQPSSSVVREEIGNSLDQKAKGLSYREQADLSGGSERGSKSRASVNTAKIEDGSLGAFQVERSSSMKASPRPLERRYINRTGTSRSLEVEESGQRNTTRDFPASEADRNLVDETSHADLALNNKVNQSSSSFLLRPESRGGISSPKLSPLEDDSRANIAGRYKRGGDANMGTGQQGNVWRASPNWSSPVIPNGFIPFQHGPPHGGFQPMIPQFPSPSLFGVRPSMEMSHSGIPYHMTNAERFSGHLRPLGWQNMMDVSGPHMHGFFGDMSNGNFRDESRMYGGADWDHNRRIQGQGWDCGVDPWKTQNGHVSVDVSSMSVKDDNSVQALEGDTLAVQSHSENNRAKSVEAGSNLTSPAKELAVSSPKILFEEAYMDTFAETIDTVERYCRHYLSKLDISGKLVDAELHTQCMGLLKCEEGCPTSDDGTAVFVNLKDGGKVVPKSHRSTLTSLFPIENKSVFQIAMKLYKEQRYELKGLPDVKYEVPQVSPPDTKIDMEVDDRKIVNASELDTPQKVEQEAALPELDREKEEEEKKEKGSSGNSGKSTEAREDVAMSEDEEKRRTDVVVIVEDDVSSKVIC